VSAASERISEQQIAEIVELALKQRLPPVFFELLMARIHALSSAEANSVISTLSELQQAEDEYVERGKSWISFWRELELRVDARINQERDLIENELFEELSRNLQPLNNGSR